jgi:hypothetical protein
MKSQYPPKHNILESISRFFDGLDETSRKVVLGGLIFVFLMAASITLVIAYYVYEPQITAWLQKSTPTQYISQNPVQYPTQISLPLQPVQVNLPTQTPSCTGASMQLGTSSWGIQPIQRNADGSVDIPPDTSGEAYWIEDLRNNSVFALSPTQANLDLLASLQGGDEATITRENCNTATFTLFAPQTGNPGAEVFLDQSAIGLIVYIPESPSIQGILVQGGLASEIITSPPTFEPSEVNAEISLLETSTSNDKQTIKVVISILNYGTEPIMLTENDISLTPEGAATLAVSRVDPQLPQMIEPSESKIFTLIFPRSDILTATLKIFTVEYDLQDY